MAPYACYRDLLYELKATEADANAPDRFHGVQYLKTATTIIERQIGVRFQPHYEIQQFDFLTWGIDSQINQITCPETMFSVVEAFDGNGESIISSLYFTFPPRVSPFRTLQLITRAGVNPYSGPLVSWYQTVCAPYLGASNAAINAVWGWHNSYSNAWADTMDGVLNNPLTAGSSTVTVTDVDGMDVYGRSPRFSPGQLIKIEEELMEVTIADGSTNVLTVLRAQNGTTASEHIVNSPISVWDTPWDIQQATARFAAYPYKRRGDYDKSRFDLGTGMGSKLPASMPDDVISALQLYANGVP